MRISIFIFSLLCFETLYGLKLEGSVRWVEQRTPVCYAEVIISRQVVDAGAITNYQGMYSINSIEPGEYKLILKYNGIKMFMDTISLTSDTILNIQIDQDTNHFSERIINYKFANGDTIRPLPLCPSKRPVKLESYTRDCRGYICRSFVALRTYSVKNILEDATKTCDGRFTKGTPVMLTMVHSTELGNITFEAPVVYWESRPLLLDREIESTIQPTKTKLDSSALNRSKVDPLFTNDRKTSNSDVTVPTSAVRKEQIFLDSIDDFLECKVFPNPCTGELNITSNKTIQGLEVLDFSGRIMKRFELNGSQRSIKTSLAGLSQGSYYIRLFVDNQMIIRKVIYNR